MTGHIEPSNQQFMQFITEDPGVAPVMLYLLRYREIADYSASPDLDPGRPVTGREAYATFSEVALPLLDGVGGTIEMAGRCHGTLIGPDDETWDDILLLRFPSSAAFVQLVSSPEYLAVEGHRIAALADSRQVRTSATRI